VTFDEAFQAASRHHGAGQLREAEVLYRAALAQAPSHAETHHRLGIICSQTNRPEQAIELLNRAIELDPHQPNYYGNLGVMLDNAKQYAQAAHFLRKAISLRHDFPDAHNNLGNVLSGLGRLQEAVASYQTAISLRPDYVEAHYNLGNVLLRRGRVKEAIAAQQRAIGLRPTYAEARCSLAAAFRENRQDEQSIAEYRKAIELRPDLGEAHHGLAAMQQEAGELEAAAASYRRASELTREPKVIDNLLVLLHLDPANDARAIFEQHAQWNRDHARALAPSSPVFTNSRDPQRRLRIGYVSANFNSHPVGRFLASLLTAHDRERVEIFCYSDTQDADARTEVFRAVAHHWRETRGLGDEQLAQLIRGNTIDILVDLEMHTRDNRMFVFARKPAPVQVTYLAFCSTTGLETIDYRFSDPWLDPDDSQQPFYSEKTVRLRSYWCYPAPEEAAEPGPLPAVSKGCITFGCLNNFAKTSRQALEMWLEILRSVPQSRLVLNAPEGSHRQRARDRAAAQGIDPARLEFVPRTSLLHYFRRYQQIDIALDPTPYAGGTTSCDALWMGVPIVTLPGQTAVSRGGVSLLSTIGLPELIARDCDDYIRIAADLARDLPRLASLRQTMRSRMQSSPLMDARAYARDVEAAYRRMWKTWCEVTG
jgi:predicted O-linked N-acetylglucosamine transferase (SPINDLY family)